MSNSRSLLDDAGFDAIGRSRTEKVRGGRSSAGRAALLAVLLAGVALVGLWNLGAFDAAAPAVKQAVPESPEASAERERNRLQTEADLKAGKIESNGA